MYPLVPTFTLFAVIWVKATRSRTQSGNRSEEQHKNLIHWARMAPIIEGGVEAPLQFLLQVIRNDSHSYQD